MKNGAENENMRTVDVHSTLGTLLEAAIRDQKTIEKAVNGLDRTRQSVTTAATELPRSVAEQVRLSLNESIDEAAERIVKRFKDANINAERAAAAYREAATYSIRRIVLVALALTAVSATAIVILAWMLMPSLAELQALRDERNALERQISMLTQYGGKSDITNCVVSQVKKKTRLCVKLDSRFGDQWGGYRIVANK